MNAALDDDPPFAGFVRPFAPPAHTELRAELRAALVARLAGIAGHVLIAELDHHCGVFLDYDTPKTFHIHTVLRTPHGNDYGRAWVRQWRADRA